MGNLGSFNIFASLLKQLVTQSALGASRRQLEFLVGRYQGNVVPSMELLVTELEWISHCFCRTYLIVDGLDECFNRETIPAALHRLSKRANVLVASRAEIDINIAFLGEPYINIDDAIGEDILTHVRWQMENNRKFDRIISSRKFKRNWLTRVMGCRSFCLTDSYNQVSMGAMST